eukprot:GHUV01049241.1.p1 GENE.GHUV01049241.1~~GHUV01049241.1.p1  ORF type:complete len:125 (+),score=3.59 GHUV01049241.1:77-451(+)
MPPLLLLLPSLRPQDSKTSDALSVERTAATTVRPDRTSCKHNSTVRDEEAFNVCRKVCIRLCCRQRGIVCVLSGLLQRLCAQSGQAAVDTTHKAECKARMIPMLLLTVSSGALSADHTLYDCAI